MRGFGYGGGVIGQGFASIVWDLVCIEVVGECGECEKVSNLYKVQHSELTPEPSELAPQ